METMTAGMMAAGTMATGAQVSPTGDLPSGMLLFMVAGVLMVLGVLVVGGLLRPRLPHPEKGAPYECGEPAIGPNWIQFDLRFYVVALVFVIFDVEIALFYPWAVVYGGGTLSETGRASSEVFSQVKVAALWDMLFFFGVIVVGFLYLWRYGYLDWVRAATGQRGGAASGASSVSKGTQG